MVDATNLDFVDLDKSKSYGELAPVIHEEIMNISEGSYLSDYVKIHMWILFKQNCDMSDSALQRDFQKVFEWTCER